MQAPAVRPISTYDNLTTTTASTAKPKMKQQQHPQWSGDSAGQLRPNSPSIAVNGNRKAWPAGSQEQASELNETSHSIAAVKAALSDAKSKFFGIHNCDTLDAPTAASPAVARDSPAAAMPSVVIKPEPKYQNVPQPTRIPSAQPEASSSPTVVSQRFGATYEQIPLSDLDAMQPTQVRNQLNLHARSSTHSAHSNMYVCRIGCLHEHHGTTEHEGHEDRRTTHTDSEQSQAQSDDCGQQEP